MKLNDIPGDHFTTAYIPGQATAGTADTWPIFVAPDAIEITAVCWVPAAAVTGNDTNYFSLAAQNKGQAGAGTTPVTATKAYTSGVDSVAHDLELLTLHSTEANRDLDAGDVLSLVRTVAASGLAMPDGLVLVQFRYR